MVRKPLVESQDQNIPITERLVKDVLEGVQQEKEEQEAEQGPDEEKLKVVEQEAKSEFFILGDLVDIMDIDPETTTPGAWFEVRLFLFQLLLQESFYSFYFFSCFFYQGTVAKIVKEEGEGVVAGCDGLTYHVKYEALLLLMLLLLGCSLQCFLSFRYDAYEGDDYKVKLENLRPRARRLLKTRELEVVFVC